MKYLEIQKENGTIPPGELEQLLNDLISRIGPRKRILVIPPDITRIHSFSGEIVKFLYRLLGNALADILPAVGTHRPMSRTELQTMFGDIPEGLFQVHNFRTDVETIGEIPQEFIAEVSGNKVAYPWPAQVNKRLPNGGYDLILSVGQVVPHEVAGMAGFNKNILVGTGGAEAINKSHYLGAVVGAENLMGRTDNPVRRVLNLATAKFTASMPIVYILTVVGKDRNGRPELKGLFAGDDVDCFHSAARLSQKLNIEILDNPIKKAVVYLDPLEYHSTWLGNKSVYRTRMAIEDGGELLVLAPGVERFGEDPAIDTLIRKYGYRTTDEILDLVQENEDLRTNLSAAAHLIHGSSDRRFRITYCTDKLSGPEIKSVHYNFCPLADAMKRYPVDQLKEGYNRLPDGEEIYYISNPALGLWAGRGRF
jgi:nickel-dependent lactate racemase